MHGGSRRGSHPRANGKASGREAGPRATHPGRAPDADRLVRLLEPVVHAMNMDLEGIRVTAAGRRRVLRVVVDADGGVSLDDIALASRELSVKLDSSAEMGAHPYTLEVSSPGVDRPLTQPRHWRRAIGRLVEVPLNQQTAGHENQTAGHENQTAGHGNQAASHENGNGAAMAEGRVVGSSERGVTLERDGVTREYQYAELGPGRVQVEFGHFDDSAGDNDLGEED
jgi:ribosome maturation factor RimP